jgi:hypothetical protein
MTSNFSGRLTVGPFRKKSVVGTGPFTGDTIIGCGTSACRYVESSMAFATDNFELFRGTTCLANVLCVEMKIDLVWFVVSFQSLFYGIIASLCSGGDTRRFFI